MRRIAILLVLVAVMLSACSAAEPLPLEPRATASASNAAPTAPTTSAAPTTAAAEQPTPTESPAAENPSTPPTPAPNTLTLWHSYAADSPEANIINDLIAQFQQSTPDLTIVAVAIPGDEIINRFETEAAASGGPDLLFAPNDSLGREARSGLLRELDSAVGQQESSQYLPNAIESMKVDGKLYGLPASLSTIALYYNAGKVQSPPRTTDELLNAVKGGTTLVLIRSAFHSFGFFGAFGGRLFDENGRCVADAGGFADALNYLRELKNAGAQVVTSGREAEALFKEGQAHLAINGSWLLGDYRAALGDQLGVAPMPSGPAGPARPLLSGSGVYLNAGTNKANEAIALGLLLTGQEAQQRYVEQSSFIPSNPNLTIANPALASFFEAAKSGTPAPNRTELDRFWSPFDGALAEVLDNNADPVATVQAACTAMNEANGK